MPWAISIQDLAMKIVKTIFVFTYLAVIAKGHKDEATSSNCDDCDNLRNRLDSLEALVHKQAAVVHRQADVIKRLLQLDKEITNLRELHKKVNRRLVLGEGANVAFTVYLGHIMHNIQDKQKLIFEKVITNEGGFYNNTTGIFTAPESGLYQFIFVIDTYGSYQSEVRLMVDGVYMMEAVAEGRSSGHNDQGCNVINVRLKRGQNVWLEQNGNGGDLESFDAHKLSSFSGVLLYY